MADEENQSQQQQQQQQQKYKGKQKISIEPITNKTRKQVTFSKRRTGLFKKAAELSKLCGSEIAIITFSGAGKLFPFGIPNADAVINRYLNLSSNSSNCNNGGFWWDEPIDHLGLSELEELKSSLQSLRNRVASRVEEINTSMMMDYYCSAPLQEAGFGGFGCMDQGLAPVQNCGFDYCGVQDDVVNVGPSSVESESLLDLILKDSTFS